MGKIDLNKKQKTEALLNSAFELFTSKGITNTTISNIVDRADVAKGTFYLYFRDKYDLHNKLIAHKASQIFCKAEEALRQTSLTQLEDRIIFLVDHILEQFNADKTLLNFIAKNLSWGIFKNELIHPSSPYEIDFYQLYLDIFKETENVYKNPEVLLFFIIELTSSTCYSSILYGEPVPIEELKPYLFDAIRQIIRSQKIEAAD